MGAVVSTSQATFDPFGSNVEKVMDVSSNSINPASFTSNDNKHRQPMINSFSINGSTATQNPSLTHNHVNSTMNTQNGSVNQGVLNNSIMMNHGSVMGSTMNGVKIQQWQPAMNRNLHQSMNKSKNRTFNSMTERDSKEKINNEVKLDPFAGLGF